jgi:membrane protein implicated in regulation of membrane protease activity
MLTYTYLFAMIVGGILLAASIFFGGDADADADVDADFDADADVDADADHGQQGITTEHLDSHGSLGGFVASFLSLRFWTFFAAFFGMTGLLLAQVSPATGATQGLVLSIGTGVVIGQITTAVFRHFAKSDTGTAATERDYVGLTGRVTVGFSSGDLGKVRVTLKGTTVDLLATCEDEEPFSKGEEVLVIQMSGTQATVARVGPKAELAASSEARA